MIEGPLAGGHLGFSKEQLEDIPSLDYDTEIQNIIALKQTYEEKYQTTIPVFVAGGMFTAKDAAHVMELGADGIRQPPGLLPRKNVMPVTHTNRLM